MENQNVIKSCGRKSYFFTILWMVVLLYIVFSLQSFLKDFLSPLLIVIIAVASFNLLLSYARAQLSTLELSENNIIVRTGIINTNTTMIPYDKIENVKVERTVIDRIFGLGVLKIELFDISHTQIVIPDIPNSKLEYILKFMKERIKR